MIDAQSKFAKRSSLGAAALLAVYVVVMTLGNTFTIALSEMARWWAYIAALAVGFGVQVGMYAHIRDLSRAGRGGLHGPSMVAGGGVSAGSMVACCLHHVTDVLPFVGLSAAGLFLADYQSVFMSLGVLSSIVGIAVMLEQLQRVSGLDHLSEGLSRALSRYRLRSIRDVTAVASGLIFIVLLAAALGVMPTARSDQEATTIVNDQSGVTFSVSSVEYDNAVGFKMLIDTHQGSLSFDLTEVATLTVEGEIYSPLSWRGSPPGGHHRSGELLFPKPREAGAMTLVISDVYGVPERVFEWGSDTAVSSTLYVWGGVSAIAAAAIVMVFRARKSPEEYYQSLFEAKLRRSQLGDDNMGLNGESGSTSKNLKWLVAAGILVAVAVGSWYMLRQGSGEGDFTLTDIDGDEFSLSDFAGKVVLLDFMATWCGPCRASMPGLVALHEELGDRVEIISITVDPAYDSESTLRAWKAEWGADWIHARDLADPPVSQMYEVTGTPTYVIIDRKGVAKFRHVGLTPEATLREELLSLLG